MRLSLLCPALLLAAPLYAQAAGKVASDAALTPIEDIGLKKRQVPAVLVAALESPYAARDTEDCARMTTAIAELDAALGPDHDKQNRRIDKSNVAKAAVGAFIPFRGIIREVSGAASSERSYTKAFNAGVARRGFLRGLYQNQGCGTGGKVPASRVVVVEKFDDPEVDLPMTLPAVEAGPAPAEVHSPVLTAEAPPAPVETPAAPAVQPVAAPVETPPAAPAPTAAAPAPAEPASNPAA